MKHSFDLVAIFSILTVACCEQQKVNTSLYAPKSIEDSFPYFHGACGISADPGLISFSAELDQLPFLALLGYKNKNNITFGHCAGALINRRFVLTAAHCIAGNIIETVGSLESVRFGEYDTRTTKDCTVIYSDAIYCREPAQDISVEISIAHPEYLKGNKKENKYDIGLVKLAQRATYSDFVKPICLPEKSSDGSVFLAAGWGSASLPGGNTPTQLKHTLHLYEKEDCKKEYEKKGIKLGDDQICARGNDTQGNCTSGPGGPLMEKRMDGSYEVRGISIFSRACESNGWPGVFTSVAGYKDWIIETLRTTNV